MSEPASRALTVRCPHCGAEYLLPRELLGPRGASVKCPSCGKRFEVPPAGEAPETAAASRTPSVSGPEHAGAAADRPAESEQTPLEGTPQAVAEELVGQIEILLGPRLASARARGRVLAEIGPELMRAFDEYRARLGADASALVFRRAVKRRLGIALDADAGPGRD